ncbi:MAG: exodeoxyribonuclease V subunit alpha [Thiomonas sp.]
MNPPRVPVADPRSQELLDLLHAWADAGVLRRLDAALARFIAELCPQATPQVLLAVAVLSHLEAQGHTCVLLDELPQHIAALRQQAAQAGMPASSLLDAVPQSWDAALRACTAVHEEGGADAGAPLVLGAARLYLRRYWRDELRVAAQVRQRLRPEVVVDSARAAAVLARLFPASAGPEVDWQKLACAAALRARLTVLTGGPGTGKTYTAARMLALLLATAEQPAALRVALAAPTGKAAARLKQSIDQALQTLPAIDGVDDLARHIGPARTLHSLLGARPDTRRFAHDAAHPLQVDVLLIDEASMIHLEMMAAVLAALPPSSRLILLGDKDQLASVEAGAVLGDLCADAQNGHYRPDTAQALLALSGQRIPPELIDPAGSALAQQVVMLRRSHRFGGSIGRLASAVHAGDAQTALALLGDPPDAAVYQLPPSPQLHDQLVDLAVAGRDQAAGFAQYAGVLQRQPSGRTGWEHWAQEVLAAFEQCRVLCAVRDGPWGVDALNAAIAERLDALGLLRCRGTWYAGRPVMVTRNDHELGVLNGDVGLVLPTPDGGLRVVFGSGPGLRTVSISRLPEVQTAFAMTVHQAQGSEFAHAVLVLPERSAAVRRELIYTGLTRARSAFTLACADIQTLREGIAHTTRRTSGLLERIHCASTP